MKVLVTGGAGYIGQTMTYLLSDNSINYVIFDNEERGKVDSFNKKKFYKGDLRNFDEINECIANNNFDLVLHFAAYAYVEESMQNPKIYYENNVIGSINLLNAMLNNNLKKIVFSSTCATYGNADGLITESTKQNPISPYGETKLFIENILKTYFTSNNLSSISLRYFNVAGCESKFRTGENHDPETHIIPLILKEALRVKNGGNSLRSNFEIFGDTYKTKDGTCERDYIHVEDLCNAHLLASRYLMKNDLVCESINLGNASSISILELLETAKKITGQEINYKIVGKREGDVATVKADIAKAKKILNWEPENSFIENIIKTAWEWEKRK